MNDPVQTQRAADAAQPGPQNITDIPAAPIAPTTGAASLEAQDHNIDPVMALRTAQADAENQMDLEKQNAAVAAAQQKEAEAESVLDKELNAQVGGVQVPAGLTPEQIASIAAGNPDPATPANPSSISSTKQTTLPELQQIVLALQIQQSLLEQRFNRLASENFKVTY